MWSNFAISTLIHTGSTIGTVHPMSASSLIAYDLWRLSVLLVVAAIIMGTGKTKSFGHAMSTTTTTTPPSGWNLDNKPIQGIVPPLVTPLKSDGTLDEDGTCRLIEHVIGGGVAGIFILGTTGEFPYLSLSLRKEFIQLCCQVVNGRVPVLVGITDCCLATTCEMAAFCKDAGAAAAVLTTPYYFPMEQSEVERYVDGLLEMIELPIVLYNMPSLTKNWFDVETVRGLAKKYPQIIGIKDSSGDLDYFAKLCKLKESERPDWTVMIGPEHLLVDAMRLGADGGVNGGANVEPETFVTLYQATKGDMEGTEKTRGTSVEAILSRVNAFQDIYKVGAPGFRFVTATKCALSLKKICGDTMAEPFCSYSEEEKSKLERILGGLPLWKACDANYKL